MSFGIIYKVTNKINGKVYIGQTVQKLRRRRKKHISEALLNKNSYHFHGAIRKHGKSNFVWEVLEKCYSQEELNNRETYYIDEYDSVNLGYNMRSFGEAQSGWNHSEETKALLSEKVKIRLATKGHPNKGRKWSKEVRERMGESHRGRKQSKQQREKHSICMSGSGNPMYGMSGALAPSSKKYIVTFPDGKEQIVHGLHSFCLENGLNSSCMVRCAKGFYKQHKKYKCRYFTGGEE